MLTDRKQDGKHGVLEYDRRERIIIIRVVKLLPLIYRQSNLFFTRLRQKVLNVASYYDFLPSRGCIYKHTILNSYDTQI